MKYRVFGALCNRVFDDYNEAKKFAKEMKSKVGKRVRIKKRGD